MAIKGTPESKDADRRICVILPLQLGYYRTLLRGISSYAPKNGRWRVVFSLFPRSEKIKTLVQDASAVICALGNPHISVALADARVPFVNVSSSREESPCPQVTLDNIEVGRVGAAHLIELGFSRLVFTGREHFYGKMRYRGFAEIAAKRNCEMIRLETLLADDARVLRELPRPTGIMASTDRHAAEVLDACRRFDIPVPDGISVLGVDDDELICLHTQPMLSSVSPDAHRIGFEAAKLVDHLLSGGAEPRKPILIKPRGIVVRGSTDQAASPDAEVSRALAYIRDRACEGITAAMVMKNVNVSRPTLEARFQKLLRRSVREEIRRVQFERAKRLLTQTALPVSEVGLRCGFDYYARFIDLFHKHVGMPPGRYRTHFKS